MNRKQIFTALAALSLVAMANGAQAGVQRSYGGATTGSQGEEPPWSFACIKDHGTSRCSDLN
jgi:hypothetical protein